MNGNVVAQGSQFALSDTQVVTATVDLDQVRDVANLSADNQDHISAFYSRTPRADGFLPFSLPLCTAPYNFPVNLNSVHPLDFVWCLT